MPGKHRDMHKFESRESPGYLSIKEEIRRMAKSLSLGENELRGKDDFLLTAGVWKGWELIRLSNVLGSE